MNGAPFGAPFGAGSPSPFGGPQSPSLAFGPGAQGQQPPRFSAGSLISDGDLPEWLRMAPDGPDPAQAPQAAWGAPAQPAPGGWGQAPQPIPQQIAQPAPPHDIAALHTVRQPAVGSPNPAQPPNGYPQQPMYPQQPGPAAYPQQPQSAYPHGYQQPSQPAYPQGYQQGYPQASAPYAPAYPQPPQQQPANYANYGRPAAPPQPPTPINAFPGIEQAGTAYSGPQRGGMAAQALLNQNSLPNWLAGAQPGMAQAPQRGATPSGMQARSLVDDQALPKWLRDQPDQTERPNVSEWIGASAAQEPMPPFLNDAYAQAQIGRAPQPGPSAFGQAGAPPSPHYGATGASTGFGDDAAMPDWLRAQAGAAPGAAPAAAPAEPAGGGGFSASDLIDPAALPAWVTGKAPAEQVFSSTHGWSAASPSAESSFGASDQGYEQGYGQGYGQDYQQGAEQAYQQSFDHQGQQGFGVDDGAQPAWGEEQWDADGAAEDAPSELPQRPERPERRGQRDSQRQPHGKPLAADELPPWLRGQAGAAGASAPMASAERNPWAGAAAPMEAWDEEEPWAAQGDAGAQGWGDASQWSGAEASDQGDQRGASMDGWGYEEPADDWGQQRPQAAAPRRQEAWDDEPSYSSGAHRGYADERYTDDRYADDRHADRYGQPPNEYGEYDGYDEYDDEPSDGKRRGGWLGFMRRNKR